MLFTMQDADDLVIIPLLRAPSGTQSARIGAPDMAFPRLNMLGTGWWPGIAASCSPSAPGAAGQ